MTTALQDTSNEPILEPEIPIVDSHHHLYVRRTEHGEERYLLDEFLSDLNTGHRIIATVFAESAAMYRRTGPEEMKPVGEIEFANGVGAAAASGAFGEILVCAGVVGTANLALGERIQPVLEAEITAGGARFRGVRMNAVYEPSGMFGSMSPDGLLLDEGFRKGYQLLDGLGLHFEVTAVEPTLPDVVDLARSFPGTRLVLTHAGFPLGIGAYAGKREERRPLWLENIRALAACDNVVVKLGGLGMRFAGFPSHNASPPATSEQIAADWAPYFLSVIEEFGAERCMFESNFPEDLPGVGSYPILWNAMKRVVSGGSPDEKTQLFNKTATDFYRLDLPPIE